MTNSSGCIVNFDSKSADITLDNAFALEKESEDLHIMEVLKN